MAAKTITITIPESQLSSLEAAASEEGISVEELVPLVLGTYANDFVALRESLERSGRDIAEGRTFSHDEVRARLEERFATAKASEAA